MGPCQSYFHKECLDKSEERYHKSEPKIKKKNRKPHGRPRKHYNKSSLKSCNSVTNVPQITSDINNPNKNELHEKVDDIVAKSFNGLMTLPNIQGELNKGIDDQLEPDKIKKENITIENVNNPGLIELENMAKDSIEENIGDTAIASTDSSVSKEKLSKVNLKYLCSLCKADKTICFVCGLDIEDSGQKITCKICKFFKKN